MGSFFSFFLFFLGRHVRVNNPLLATLDSLSTRLFGIRLKEVEEVWNLRTAGFSFTLFNLNRDKNKIKPTQSCSECLEVACRCDAQIFVHIVVLKGLKPN